MKDFIKIFVGISLLAVAFMLGSNYGEKIYRESAEYKNFIRASEELNFAKSELENVKAKLQNITDQAETKKTDELLAQILHVFLTDLGLRIQNQEAILKQAQQLQPPALPTPPEDKKIAKTEEKIEARKQNDTKINLRKFKTFEWMVQNSSGGTSVLRDLKKVQIKNLNSFLEHADYADTEGCEQLLGVYKGLVKDINNKKYGAVEFELKTGQVNNGTEFYGKAAWYYNGRASSEKINNNCGKKLTGLDGRIFSLARDKYIQIYKLSGANMVAGNFYKTLPNGTTMFIGSFSLGRVDRF